MALRPLNPSGNPLGQFDVHDSEAASFLGGEVCTFAATLGPSQPGITGTTDQAAYDVFDGYVKQTGGQERPMLTKTFTASASPANRPLLLADDGILHYGTILGSVIGGTVGQNTTGTVVGPSSLTGSGKLTAWQTPGIFAVSLDAVDTATDGLTPTSTLSGGLYVGMALKYTLGGLLTPTGSTNATANTGCPAVANFIEFATNGSLVTTPNYLTQALNSPSGPVSSVTQRQFTYAVIAWNPPVAG